MTKSESSGQKSAGQSMSSASANKTTPKDVQVVSAILKDMAVFDYEPRVVHQLLEFAYRYVANVLEEANTLSSYAKKKTIDVEDIRLAIQMQVDKCFITPPPRDILLDIARNKNNQPLPPIKSHNGPRLPADRYSLVSCNFKQKSLKQSKQQAQVGHLQLPYRTSLPGTSILSSTGALGSSTILKPVGAGRPTVTLIQRSGVSNTSVLNSESTKRKIDDV